MNDPKTCLACLHAPVCAIYRRNARYALKIGVCGHFTRGRTADKQILRLKQRLETIKRERDAAVSDLGSLKSCSTCKHMYKGSVVCGDCRFGDKWAWKRGGVASVPHTYR